MFFQVLGLILENKSALNKAYISKRLIGCIFIICHNIWWKCKQLRILLVTAHRYNKVLDQKLSVLVKKAVFC